MKKTLISILLSLLCVLFLITACESPAGVLPQETTVGGTPAGSDISPDETTADIENTKEELESTSEEVTTLPEYFETFAPEQREKLLQHLQKYPQIAEFCNEYPKVFDINFSCCVSSDVFYSLLEELNGAPILFYDLIQIVGRPHNIFSATTATIVFQWLTSDEKLFNAYISKTLDHPENTPTEERFLYYSKVVLPDPYASISTRDPNTTITTPETTTANP